MYDNLFAALAQAKSLPSKAYRTAISALDIPGEALQGYSQGLQLKRQIQQPQALARLLNATPQGHEIVETMGPEGAAAALTGSEPKDILDYAGKQAQLQQQGNLGYAGIAERGTASKNAYDAAMARTNAQEDIASGRTLSGAIGMHQQAINDLTNNMTRLSTSLPSGLGGTIQNLLSKNQDVSQYLSDPRYSQTVAQMRSLQSQIGNHQATIGALTRQQGLAGSGLTDNSDLSGINPSSQPGQGGDTSTSGLPGLQF